MGRGKHKQRAKSDERGPLQRLHDRAQSEREARQAPTAEQQGRAEFVRFAGRYKRVPVIDTMRDRKQITRDEHRVLARYRDMAGLAACSPVKSCLDVGVGGAGGAGLPRSLALPRPAATVSAELDTARMERDMGQLADIARAVAVDDLSLSEWCIAKHGGRERMEGGKVRAIVPPDGTVKVALMELRTAAWRLGAHAP